MAIDSQNMIGIIKDFAKHCRGALELPRGISVTEPITSIVVLGMGGSAMGGDILRSLMYRSPIPVHVVRDYTAPGFVNEETLVFVISYSGNTEETLSAFRELKDKTKLIIGITSGGTLAEECERIITVPGGLQPRAALGYLFFPMLGVLHNAGIVRIKNDELNDMIECIKKVDELEDEAKKLAQKIKDKIPIIYASEQFKAVAYRWKTQINENGKMPVFTHTFSEMNHNEIVGYQSMDRKFAAIVIRDPHDHEQIKKRMDICKDIMEERVDVHEVYTEGKSLLARIFSTILLGDLVSYHCALWNRVDPTPVDVIEDLKKKLVE